MSHLCVPLATSHTLQASITSALAANTSLAHSDAPSTLKHACRLLPMVTVAGQGVVQGDGRHSVGGCYKPDPWPLCRLEKNLSGWLSSRNSQQVLRQSALHPYVIHLPAFASGTEEASTGLLPWRTPVSSVLSREDPPLQLQVMMKQCEALVAVRLIKALSLRLDLPEQPPSLELYHPPTKSLTMVPASSTHSRQVLASPPVSAAALHAGLPRPGLAASEPCLDTPTAAGAGMPNSFSLLGTAVSPASFLADRQGTQAARHTAGQQHKEDSGQGRGGSGSQWQGGHQEAGRGLQFLLLLGAALAGTMGLYGWSLEGGTASQVETSAPAAAADADRGEEHGEVAGEVQHPERKAIEVMKEAVEHFEGRQQALQLELHYLKGIRRPSADDIQRNKEVVKELESLAILKHAVQQELLRMGP